jgi:hypothetical protein
VSPFLFERLAQNGTFGSRTPNSQLERIIRPQDVVTASKLQCLYLVAQLPL